MSPCAADPSVGGVNRYRWRMTNEGLVVISEPPAYVEKAPVLDELGALKMMGIERDWGSLCRERAADYEVPDGWLQAMIYRESGGNPWARNVEPNGWVGVGLLQITHPSLKAGRPDSEVILPTVNVKIAAAYIAGLIKRYGADFPKIAAAFNHGSVAESDKNPWGLVSTGSHISVEVMALNTWVKARAEAIGQIVATTFFDLTPIAREADDEARHDTEPAPPPDDAA